MLRRVSFLLLFLASVAAPTFAHAILLEVQPPANGAVAEHEVVFQLRFNSRIDGARCSLSLVLPDKSVRAVPMSKQPSPDRLVAPSGDMKSGQYILRWQVLAADGHITRGEVHFAVR